MKLLVTEKNINIFYNFLHFKTMFETLYIFKELEYITFNWITPRSQFNVLIDDINAILTQYMFNNDYTFKTFKYDHLVQLIDDDGVMVSCDTYDTYENNMIECIAMMLINTSDILELTLSYIRTYYKKEYELVNMIYSQYYNIFTDSTNHNLTIELCNNQEILTYKQYKDRDRKIKELIC